MGTSTAPLVPDQKLAVISGKSGAISFPALALIGAAYVIYDPLAPNWDITETRLDERSYRLDLEMKRFNTGGDGDALWIVKRRGKQLQQMSGMGGFRIQSFDQRIDSQTIGARREVEAVIVLIPESLPILPAAPLEILPNTSPDVTTKPIAKKRVAAKKAAKPAVKSSSEPTSDVTSAVSVDN